MRFESTRDAEEAGFRACRRCRPELAAQGTPRIVERAQAFLDDHLDENVTLERLGRAVGSSPFHLQRTFKRALAPYVSYVQSGKSGFQSVTLPFPSGFEYSVRT